MDLSYSEGNVDCTINILLISYFKGQWPEHIKVRTLLADVSFTVVLASVIETVGYTISNVSLLL